jgi:hypothetical protein
MSKETDQILSDFILMLRNLGIGRFISSDQSQTSSLEEPDRSDLIPMPTPNLPVPPKNLSENI